MERTWQPVVGQPSRVTWVGTPWENRDTAIFSTATHALLQGKSLMITLKPPPARWDQSQVSSATPSWRPGVEGVRPDL